MRETRITNFINFKRKYKVKPKTYHFDRSRYELILLKQLEDNKIFYNGIIYEQNFLYFHKLEAFVKKIYALRDEYILKHFQLLSRKELKRLKKRSKKYNFINQTWIPYSKPYKIFKTIDDILKEGNTFNAYQIKVLVNAFRYTFHYSLDYDLLDPYTRRRPIYQIDPKCDLIDPDVRIRNIYKNEVKTYKYLMVHPSFYQSHKAPLLINIFFEDWFYIIGWRAIKRVHPTFELQSYSHYTDSLRRKSFARLHEKERVEPEFRSSLFVCDQGTTIRDEWIIEYDEKKKFDEYDIHCKTNSYYTRYKRYNEFYHTYYPENKKFKTTLIHDFTDYEIEENYANMIDKTKIAKEKWEYVMHDGKYKNAVFDFFTRLEQQQDARRRYEYPSRWYLDAEEDSNTLLDMEIEEEILQLLNDPQYILVMPLVDAYFEIFRTKGWYHEDESFNQFYPTEKKIWKHIEFYDMSHERQYSFIEKTWLIDDYLEVEWEEYAEDYRDEEYTWIFGTYFLFFWLAGLNFYVILVLNGLINLPLNVQRINDTVSASYEYFFNRDFKNGRKRSYYGLELRKARLRYHTYRRSRRLKTRWREWRLRIKHKMYKFPSFFYKDGNYTFYKQRTWVNNSLRILVRWTNFINDADYGFRDFETKCRWFGINHNIYRFRILFIEDSMPRELQLFWPKIVKLWNDIIGSIIYYLQKKQEEALARLIRKEAPAINYNKYQFYYRHPVIVPIEANIHEETRLLRRKKMTVETRARRKCGRMRFDEVIGEKRSGRIFKKLRNRYIRILHHKLLTVQLKKTRTAGLFWTQGRRKRATIPVFELMEKNSIEKKEAIRLIYGARHRIFIRQRKLYDVDELFEIREDIKYYKLMGDRRR